MAPRTQLQSDLVSILGSPNVYFQPPSGFLLSYPCIIYSRSDIHAQHADNKPYRKLKEYKITVIDADPDSLIPDKIADLPQCSYDRGFKTDQLNHDIFTLLY
jgi:hypothetical protein